MNDKEPVTKEDVLFGFAHTPDYYFPLHVEKYTFKDKCRIVFRNIKELFVRGVLTFITIGLLIASFASWVLVIYFVLKHYQVIS